MIVYANAGVPIGHMQSLSASVWQTDRRTDRQTDRRTDLR